MVRFRNIIFASVGLATIVGCSDSGNQTSSADNHISGPTSQSNSSSEVPVGIAPSTSPQDLEKKLLLTDLSDGERESTASALAGSLGYDKACAELNKLRNENPGASGDRASFELAKAIVGLTGKNTCGVLHVAKSFIFGWGTAKSYDAALAALDGVDNDVADVKYWKGYIFLLDDYSGKDKSKARELLEEAKNGGIMAAGDLLSKL